MKRPIIGRQSQQTWIESLTPFGPGGLGGPGPSGSPTSQQHQQQGQGVQGQRPLQQQPRRPGLHTAPIGGLPLPNIPRPRSGAEGSGPGRAGDGMPRDVEIDPTDTRGLPFGASNEPLGLPPKQKTQLFDFRYDDTDTLMNELDEFYPYIEMLHIGQNPPRFYVSFKGDWTSASLEKRREYVEVQLEYLESPINETRRTAQGSLLYLLQGCFAETTSPETQLHWVIDNAKIIRAVDGVATLVYGLRDAARRYDAEDNIFPPNADQGPHHERTGSASLAPVDPYDSRSAELMDLLAMLYFIVEVFRNDETFGDELMAMDPPLPLMLFGMVSNLKDRSVPKGYPVKKVLLLLWKTLLACLGGMREAAKAKALSREWAGLGPEQKDFTKASPMDIASWRRDTSTKYPTFAPPPSISAGVPVSTEQLADSIKPLPARTNYHSTEISYTTTAPGLSTPAPTQSLPLPGTPAPSPPPTPPQPRAKKLQYQTDPTRPFVFPYSQSTQGPPTSLVPFAIDEADKLYHAHAFVPLGLYQLWQTREECVREERGLGRSGLIGFSALTIDDDDTDEFEEEALRRDWQYEDEERRCLEEGDKEGVKLAKEKRAAARRLYRVEIIYRSIMPLMQNTVIVLLKLLLATVTGTGNPPQQPPHSVGGPGMQSPTQELPPIHDLPLPPPTKEEVDIARHREITSKAVSAILILMLKWFKASHVLKFHHLAQLLLDSNCLVLILKIFGLQECSAMVQTKNEIDDCSFFRYCQVHYTKFSPERPEDEMFHSNAAMSRVASGEDDEEVELVTDYSWRNFFAAINLIKVLQKITKHRVHRILLMCQYKSSAIFKRMLRVNQPMLQLQVLKLIKSQMPYCGRKWRSNNMKVITSIYLNCRPELRNEWLTGVEADLESEDAHVGKPQELALRALIQFYNKGYYVPSSYSDGHRRHDSSSAIVFDDQGFMPVVHRRQSRLDSVSGDAGDVFPPPRSISSSATALPYNPDGMIEFWMHEYEDVLREVFGEGTGTGREEEWGDDEFGPYTFGTGAGPGARSPRSPHPAGAAPAPGPAERDDAAWTRLGEIMRANGAPEDDTISDSESVVSIGELGDDARLEAEAEGRDMFAAMTERQRRKSKGDENTWEHMSPNTLKLLPRSPSDRRRSSSGGSPLRPIGFASGLGSLGAGLGLGVGLDDVFDDDGSDLPGPMPINPETRDELERDFGAVDEVEYAYGE